MVNVGGLIACLFVVIIIIVLVIYGLISNNQLNACQKGYSEFCYTIHCPCNDPKQAPCFGYAQAPGPRPGTWYCSNAPSTAVNNDGSIAR